MPDYLNDRERLDAWDEGYVQGFEDAKQRWKKQLDVGRLEVASALNVVMDMHDRSLWSAFCLCWAAIGWAYHSECHRGLVSEYCTECHRWNPEPCHCWNDE